MTQRAVTWFLLVTVYWAGTSGQEACFSNDMNDIMVRLRNFQTQYHDTIKAIQGQISEEEGRKSSLELEIADLKYETADLEKNVQTLEQLNQQLEKETEKLEEETSLFESEIRNLTHEGLEQIADLQVKKLDHEKNVRRMMTTSDTQITTIREQVEKLEMNHSILDDKVRTMTQETKERLADLTEESLDLENSVRNFSTTTDTKIKTIQEQTVRLEIRNSALGNEIRTLTQATKRQIADLTEESLNLENTIRNLTTTTNTKLTTMEELIAKLDNNNSLVTNEMKNVTNGSLEQITDMRAESLNMESNFRNFTTNTYTKIAIIQEQKTVFAVAVSDLKKNGLELEQKVQTLAQENQQQDTDIERLKFGVSVEKLVFRAKTPENTTYSAGEILVFTIEEFDTQNSYDNSTGKFTAPVAGTYMFTVEICENYQGNIMRFTLKSSNSLKDLHASVHYYGFVSTSVTTVIPLEKSEAVWVEITYFSSSNYNRNCCCLSMFCGTLLAL